jgi:hypothetical protein
MKKIIIPSVCIALCSNILFAQQDRVTGQTVPSTQPAGVPWCASKAPDPSWDQAFNKEVEKYKANMRTSGTTSITNYVVPVIVHVIHSGQAEGTWPNISQAQVNSQIVVLNNDYSNNGAGVTQYNAISNNGHGAFYDYAQANSLPAPDNTTSGVVPCNTGIQFCMATVDPNGKTLAEPGIDRVNYTTAGFAGPSSSTSANFDSYLDATLKPAVIWDNTKYMNIYVSDRPSGSGLLGYTTFPAGTTLSGLTSGAGTTKNDGVWVYGQSFGTTGTLVSGYEGGQVCGHESGHYFGLRHPWGDGTCLTDYCNDTPPSYAANYPTGNTIQYPYTNTSGTCSGSNGTDNGDGEMYENLMDYSEDVYKYMFTNDQVTRMQTAMQTSPYRKTLSNSVCASNATGIFSQLLQNNIVAYPNPGNGNINFVTTLPVAVDLAFVVTNVLGQVVAEKSEKNVSNNVLNLDLSGQAKGVYFVNISSSQQEKTIKKIIIE